MCTTLYDFPLLFLSLLVPYSTEKSHSARCKAKCTLCCTLSWDTPCAPDGTAAQKCGGCRKLFKNAICYQRHLDKNVCSMYKKCDDCGLCYKAIRRKDEYGNVRPFFHFCSKQVFGTSRCIYYHDLVVSYMLFLS